MSVHPLQLIDRKGRVVPCLATMRWHWGTNRHVVCYRFWPTTSLSDDETSFDVHAAV